MTRQVSVFFTGVTGYIGGSVFQRLLEHPSFHKSFNIVALLRSAEKAEKLRSYAGVTPIIGSLDDVELVERLASQADIVIATADTDHLPATLATLRGLRKRYEATRFRSSFIHTSGTAALGEDTGGESEGVIPSYDDRDADRMESVPSTCIHRDVDLTIVNADQEGYVRTYIIMPSIVYGIAKGALVDSCISNQHSMTIPLLVRLAMARGQAGMYGQGKNLWPHVHIDDNTDLYALVIEGAIRDQIGHGREGYYIAASGHCSLYEIAKTISTTLFKLGKATSMEPSSFTEHEKRRYFKGVILGTSVKVTPSRPLSIGWKPKNTTRDLLEYIPLEVEMIVNATQQPKL